jgi:hypothetical protein
MSNTWGHCKNCKHFGSPAAIPLGDEEARCHHHVLARFELSVFGSSGCNAFTLRAGLSADVERAQPNVALT